jgi:hypothetical protein
MIFFIVCYHVILDPCHVANVTRGAVWPRPSIIHRREENIFMNIY